jgi:2-polyprenyl-3-methyl-5-hydroxy-6-metoxy-1,4-benzoquinol methylase
VTNIQYPYSSSGGTSAHEELLPPVERLFRTHPLLKGRSLCVLDAGCGNGYVGGKLLALGHDVYGLDSSRSGIEIAARTHPEGHWCVGSVYDPLFPDCPGGFDAVLSLEVIEHLIAPRTFVKNVRDALKPGGILILSTPYNGYLKNLAIALVDGFDRHVDVLWDGGHIKFWSKRTLRKLLDEAGFLDLVFRGVGRGPWLWKSVIATCQKPE